MMEEIGHFSGPVGENLAISGFRKGARFGACASVIWTTVHPDPQNQQGRG